MFEKLQLDRFFPKKNFLESRRLVIIFILPCIKKLLTMMMVFLPQEKLSRKSKVDIMRMTLKMIMKLATNMLTMMIVTMKIMMLRKTKKD